jgi:hypothetical protein
MASKEYAVVITNMEVVYVNAESEEQAIASIKAQLPPRSTAEVTVAKEAIITENT